MISHALWIALLLQLTCLSLLHTSLARSASEGLKAKDGSISLSPAVYGDGGDLYGDGGDVYADGGGGGSELGHKFLGLQSLVAAIGQFFYALLQTIGLVPKADNGGGGGGGGY